MYVVIWGLKKIGCLCVAKVIGRDGRAYNIKILFSLFLLFHCYSKAKKRIWQLVVGRIIGIMTTLSVLSSNYW